MTPELDADAFEALEAGKVLEGEALRLVLELLRERPGVETELDRRRALRRWDELRPGYPSAAATDRRVAAFAHKSASTIRWWRAMRGNRVES